MAPVSLPEYDADDRAQLVLVTGLALAISLVAIALVLNSAIYTHNLASRYDSPGDGVAMANGDVREGAGAQIRHVNDEYAGADYATIRSNYQGDLPDVEDGLASDAAVNGRLYRVTDAGATQGVRIVDAASGGSDFVDRQDSVDWTVVSQGNVRSFRVAARTSGTVTETTSNVLGGLLGSGVFTVAFDDDGDGTGEYRVAIYENGDTGASDISVTVENVDTGTQRTCTVADTRVVVDFTRGTLGGEACNALAFVDDLSAPYDVRYADSDAVSGSYRMVVDVPVDDETSEVGPFTDGVDAANYGSHCAGPTFYDVATGASDGDFPRISPAIYAATVDVTYDSDDISYEGTQRIAPGETGTPPQAPRITSFDVDETDTDAADGEFTVTWTATDPNGDSVDATIEVVEPDGQVKQITAPGGSPATVDVDDEVGEYTVRLIVDDGPDDTAVDGNSRTVVQVHEDDGDESGCPP